MMKLKLSIKIIGGFMVVALITLLVGYSGWKGVTRTAAGFEEVARIDLPGLLGLEQMNEAKSAIHRSERVLVHEKDSKIAAEYYSSLNGAKKRAEEGWNRYQPLMRKKKGEGDKKYEEIFPVWEQWKKLHEEVISLVRKGDHKAAYALSYGKAAEVLAEYEKVLDEFIEVEFEEAGDIEKYLLPQAARAKFTSWVGTIVGTVLAILLGIYLSLSIVRPTNRIIKGLSESAEQVASASSQIASSSQSLAEGTSEQAAGLEETSSSIEEMTSMTRQNADNANQANTLMADTSRVVEEANHAMKALTQSMNEISTASEETGKIIKTIDEIAFQTNLLALNAAVEAARAGEAGAGFAVVANEVKNLAMRAAEAAKNTANLIEGTVKRIQSGSEIVSKTNEAFGKVATGAKKVGQLVGEISAASQEQAQGIEQVNKAVAGMDKVVQKNAAGAEESASAAEEMSAQSEQMKGFVAELVALVGGRNGSGAVSARSAHPIGQNGGHGTALHYPLKDEVKEEGHTHVAAPPFIQKRSRPQKGAGSKRSSQKDPKEVIPLDEGKDKDEEVLKHF